LARFAAYPRQQGEDGFPTLLRQGD
jgi:hypothetical protein